MACDYDKIRSAGLESLKARFGEDAVERSIDYTTRFQVEVPGWLVWDGFGGGGRFEGGGLASAARNTEEIAEDIGFINKLTNATPFVGQHLLWFMSKDGVVGDMETARKVKEELAAHGLSIGSISPTYFLAGSENGSLSAADKTTRERYIEQTRLSAEIAAELAGGLVTLWLPDGTNYPGQRYLQEKIELVRDALISFWEKTSDKTKDGLSQVLVEYKVFEPGTYSTTVPDWGTARELSRLFGDKGGVLVDMGHHHHSSNIEQIVGTLISFGVRGGFHFNTRYAADDDHAVQADYPMAMIFYELIQGDVLFNSDSSKNWAYALDLMARTEKRIPFVMKSVDALKRSIAKAALVNSDALTAAQDKGDLIAANVAFEEALLHADPMPILMESYVRQGLHPEPLAAYYESGYEDEIAKKRS